MCGILYKNTGNGDNCPSNKTERRVFMKLKIAALSIMAAAAVLSVVVATASQVKAEGCTAPCFAEPAESSYVLRDYEGFVAVFVENDPDCPMTVTDIEVSTLRDLDRRLLQTGMKISSQESLMMTLEDLNS